MNERSHRKNIFRAALLNDMYDSHLNETVWLILHGYYSVEYTDLGDMSWVCSRDQRRDDKGMRFQESVKRIYVAKGELNGHIQPTEAASS